RYNRVPTPPTATSATSAAPATVAGVISKARPNDHFSRMYFTGSMVGPSASGMPATIVTPSLLPNPASLNCAVPSTAAAGHLLVEPTGPLKQSTCVMAPV